MGRKTLDRLLAAGGLVVAAILLIAAGLLYWAHNFVDDEVHSQLAAQKIFFPPKGSEGLQDPQIKPYLDKYAGKQLVNGTQAQAYADHFIAVHLKGIGGGKTYAQLSTESLQNPDDTALAGKVQTMFRGETLRGLLLNAYAFGKMAQIAMWAAVTALIGAVVMTVLAALGFAHARRAGTPPAAVSEPAPQPLIVA